MRMGSKGDPSGLASGAPQVEGEGAIPEPASDLRGTSGPIALLPASLGVLSSPGAPFVATCLEARHPTLVGRVLARVEPGAPGEPPVERWVPALTGLAVREGDRLLLVRPSNFPEPVAVGILDGFAERPEPVRRAGAEVALKSDEVLRVTTEAGEPVAEVRRGEAGPVVRLLSEAADVELSGNLRISAKSIELVARSGEAKLVARDDVVVRGENIELN